jgi:hypothetical protein
VNLAADPVLLGRELRGWAILVVLCGLPSGVLATLEFRHPEELAAMALGVALLIAGMAWFHGWQTMTSTPARLEFLRSLKMAAGIKASLSVIAAVGWALTALGVQAGGWLLFVMAPDLAAGIGSLGLLQILTGTPRIEDETGDFALRGFGWILSATVLEGALMAGCIAIGATAICLFRRFSHAWSATAAT